MTDLTAIGDNDARTLFTTVRDYPFTFASAQLPALLEHLAWNVTAELPQRSLVAASSWNMPKARVYITRYDDDIRMIDIDLTNRLSHPTPETTSLLHDSFAHLTALATDILGHPTRFEPGELPSIRWRLGPTTLILTRLPRTVSASWVTTAYQDEEDAREQDEDE